MAKKQFEKYATGEQDYYVKESSRKTANVPSNLEAIRESLSMYPQAFGIVLEAVRELPYDAEKEKEDAFVAWRLVEILSTFADRLREVGVRAVDDPYEHFARVDLSAAKESGGAEIDDKAVRQSALNQAGSTDDASTASTDEDVAKSAEVADDAAIRESLGVEKIDDAMEQITVDAVSELVESAGVTASGDDGESSATDDAENEEDAGGEEYGGSEAVQLGMLDSEGTRASPERCARKATEILYSAIICGFSGEGEQRPGLAKRMRSLVDHGVRTRQEINQMLSSVMEKGKNVRFRIKL